MLKVEELKDHMPVLWSPETGPERYGKVLLTHRWPVKAEEGSVVIWVADSRVAVPAALADLTGIDPWEHMVQVTWWGRRALRLPHMPDEPLFFEGCLACDEALRERSTFFPPHVPSKFCESNGRPHCTCDRCF